MLFVVKSPSFISKFFDVRETKAGDYYLTITESKKFTNEDGTFYYKKHKIYLYKEDFAEFNSSLKETCDYIIENKGTEVISEKHDKDFESKKVKKENSEDQNQQEENVEEENVEEEKDFADSKIYHPTKNLDDSRSTNNLKDLYECDGIVIASPNNTHFEYLKDVIENSKCVLFGDAITIPSHSYKSFKLFVLLESSRFFVG
jgi:thymidylate synthase